jgi:pimeloyl-ACP methyl ester carboxylesterase
MTTYVLVPGACHGAWCFDGLTESLRAQGHRVLPVSLTGIAERAHLLHAGVNLRAHLLHAGANLEMHIADVLAELAVHEVDDAVLVGHSYGGMVITAVADRVPQQVNSLVYLDAFVPRGGESCCYLKSVV